MLEKYLEFLNMTFESLGDAVVFVDDKGKIQMLTKEYADFLNVKMEDAIGKDAKDIIENTRMDIITKTGKKEIEDIHSINGKHMIATRVPIEIDGKIIGSLGKVLFKDIEELNKLHKKISKMEEEINKHKNALKNETQARYDLDNIITVNKRMNKIKDRVREVSKTNSNILITGESGTGKELFAHSIYNNSKRKGEAFIKVNCSAIPSELLESELFGYEDGSFTGARKGGKIGKFEAADGGIIFLDEIGELPLNMQGKLLRVLQEKEIEKIGSVKSKSVDVRVIAVTNRDLIEMVQLGTFRLDLYYRLNVVNLDIPPLRDRIEDISVLSQEIIKKISKNEGIKVKGISKDAMRYLEYYSWPGNVRELENVLERAINFLGNEKTIQTKHLPPNVLGKSQTYKIDKLSETMSKIEREEISRALLICEGNKAEAARYLDISRTSLYNKIKEYNI